MSVMRCTLPVISVSLSAVTFYRSAAFIHFDMTILSVRPSVTRWYCMKTIKHIANVLSPPNSLISFHIIDRLQNSEGITPCKDRRYKGCMKIVRVSAKKSLYLRNCARMSYGCIGPTIPKSYVLYQITYVVSDNLE